MRLNVFINTYLKNKFTFKPHFLYVYVFYREASLLEWKFHIHVLSFDRYLLHAVRAQMRRQLPRIHPRIETLSMEYMTALYENQISPVMHLIDAYAAFRIAGKALQYPLPYLQPSLTLPQVLCILLPS